MKKGIIAPGLLLLALLTGALVPSTSFAQRQLSEEELSKLRDSMARRKGEQRERERLVRQNEAENQRQALARQQEEERFRQEEDAIAREAERELEQAQQTASQPGFADLLIHGMGVLQNEMAIKHAEQAAAEARIDRLHEQSEAIERERQRIQREREAQQERQRRQLAQQPVSSQSGTVVRGTAAQERERQLRDNVAAERQRLAQQQRAATAEAENRAKVDAELKGQRQAERELTAAKEQAVEHQRKAEAERLKGLRQAEQNLRSSFQGRATSCIGGGKDVLYLQSSAPPRAGCNVSFEARCPGNLSTPAVGFSQVNYVGASCMGLGDNIRIGPMGCPADQVRITMTNADCGSGG